MGSSVLFVHNNFPAQFRDLAGALRDAGVACYAIGAHTSKGVPGVMQTKYKLGRGSTPNLLPLAVRAEADMLRGRAAYRAGQALKEQGVEPDVIVGHPGWGETLFLDELWPDARQVAFAEFFYHGRGLDIGFDTEFGAPTEEAILLGKSKNATMALAYTDADVIVSPTEFQASTLPDVFRPRLRVFHEGVDVEAIRPGPAEPFELPDGRTIAPGTPVITHINNAMEPMRGLHILARALPKLLAAVPEAHVIIIGQEDKRGYGGAAPDGLTWKEFIFRDVPIDPERVHFLGRVPHAQMLAALRLSTAHVYYTYPFVLSWSLAEAMASGCYVIGSDTPPLRDAIQDGVHGRLLPFFDVSALSEAMIDACRDPGSKTGMRKAARATAEAMFDKRQGRESWLNVLRELGVEIPAGA
ncbi:glycosyltransferase [Phenylobacterium sp. J367]|uniref:glycosyltransferase n=1 Tax=Phenylobacterium sp. J367 TaxID=2898435 RepID=UPI0021510A50|nr:glycosyltransferase [Phenylobacterium sp. J367]MCR5880309.1 glycosyltransferase [Phenylobacterium sp. J367]